MRLKVNKVNLSDVKLYINKNTNQIIKATKILDEDKMIIFLDESFNNFYSIDCDKFNENYKPYKKILKD